ncbi:MAG: hypothetical protein E7157_05815 [Lactobacillales bacterium]|nr:hypothetical protein [Lactobacillales bacterium]
MEKVITEEIKFNKYNEDNMNEIDIKREKVDFLEKNKDVLIGHFSSINYLLFNILISDKELEKIGEYKQIIKLINNRPIREEKYCDATELIFYLASILNKQCMSEIKKSEYTTQLYSYLSLFKKVDNPYIKRRKSA